jgi:Flp pilus assembly protein TadD
MRLGIARALVVAAAGLWLAGCNTTGITNPFDTAQAPGTDAFAAAPAAGDDAADPAPGALEAGLLGGNPSDDLSLGKKYYRANNFGFAEKYFRRAVEQHPRDAEAWLGLAASYDRLRRFDLADRAYAEAFRIVGPTVELLNDEGFSYMLRGDYARAHKILQQAAAKDPANPYVQANMQLLEDSVRLGKAIQ